MKVEHGSARNNLYKKLINQKTIHKKACKPTIVALTKVLD